MTQPKHTDVATAEQPTNTPEMATIEAARAARKAVRAAFDAVASERSPSDDSEFDPLTEARESLAERLERMRLSSTRIAVVKLRKR